MKELNLTMAQQHLTAGDDPINVNKVKFNSCRCSSSTAIIILYRALLQKPPPCMFTAHIAFKETPSFKAPEDGLDISREHSLKGGIFIERSIESDSAHSLAPTLVRMEVFHLPYFTLPSQF